jgi:SNF2 family DNA or RNA helicase
MEVKEARHRAVVPHPRAGVIGGKLAYVGTEGALALLEAVPGARYALGSAGERAVLLLPPTVTALRMLETVGKLDGVEDAYLALRAELLPSATAWEAHYPEPAPGLPPPFRHQVECLAECLRVFGQGGHGFGCWLDMGMGKSRLATDLMRALRCGLVLVLCPKVIMEQWRVCATNGYPGAEVLVLTGPVVERGRLLKALARQEQLDPTILILNWDVLYLLQEELAALAGKLDLIVADEASRIRGRTSQVSRAARKVARAARWRVTLTGTPMGADPGDLWAQFQFTDPTVFPGSYWSFMKRYCHLGGFTGWQCVGVRTDKLPELVDRMYRTAYRATKAAVTDMPPKTYREVRLKMSPAQAKVYQQVTGQYGLETALADGRKGTLTIASAIARCTRQQQVTAGLLPLTEVEGEDEGRVDLLPSPKTEWVLQFCLETIENSDAQIIVWTRFQPELDRVVGELQAAGLAVGAIDGRTKPAAREVALGRFGDRGDSLRILVINVSAGAYGIDAPAADVLIYHSGTFQILERLQSEDRGHRLGRRRSYVIYDLILQGTIDEDIDAARKKRVDLIKTLVSDGTALAAG